MGERRTWVSAEKSVLADSCCERRQEQGPYNNLHRSEKKQIPPRCSCDVCVCVCVCVCVSQWMRAIVAMGGGGGLSCPKTCFHPLLLSGGTRFTTPTVLLTWDRKNPLTRGQTSSKPWGTWSGEGGTLRLSTLTLTRNRRESPTLHRSSRNNGRPDGSCTGRHEERANGVSVSNTVISWGRALRCAHNDG